jgi:2-polyprenyl-6-methoxyphenol hydroxylase-like FAD-dependent oxidoreductase
MSEDAYAPQSPPRCIIVGGGIAGIFLGILLDRAGIPYDIFERAPSVKQLGTIQPLSPHVQTVLSYNGNMHFSPHCMP